MKTDEQVAVKGVKELRNALRAEMMGYERGGPRPSLYDIQRALDYIVEAAEGKR